MLDELFGDNTFLSKEILCNLENLSENEKREFIKKVEKNNRFVYLKKLSELKEYKNQIVISPEMKIKEELLTPYNIGTEEEENKCDVSFYFHLLKNCKNETEYHHALPKRNNPQFQLLMNLLIGESLKEIHEYEMLFFSDDLNEMDKNLIKEELCELRKMMDYLVSYRDLKNVKEEEKEMNTLIYLKSSNHNYYAISDLKGIDIEYYDSFLELMESIQNGMFKGVKVFKNNEKLDGLCEVRNFKTRIVFKRISNDTYAILSLFMKKADNEKSYRLNLYNRMDAYNVQKEYMKMGIQNKEYLKENQKVTEEMKRILRRENE